MKTVNRVLGIDPSTSNTGWAVLDDNGTALKIVAYGHISTTAKSLKPEEKLQHIYEAVNQMIDEHKPDAIAIEDQFFRFPEATKAVLRARAVVELAGVQASIQIITLYPKVVKKSFTGNGNASKELMVEVANKRYGVDVIKDDEADAIAIAETAFKQIKGA